MAKELIPVSQYIGLADNQRNQIIDKSKHGAGPALSADQWRIVSAYWMLISKGVYLPGTNLPGAIKTKLRYQSIRDEATNYIRSHRFTLDVAADILGLEAELAEYHRVESERPVLATA